MRQSIKLSLATRVGILWFCLLADAKHVRMFSALPEKAAIPAMLLPAVSPEDCQTGQP
jgi:hypothetical protein